jgi:hypothetical protein
MTNLQIAFQRGFWKAAMQMGGMPSVKQPRMPVPQMTNKQPLPLAHPMPLIKPPNVIPQAPQMQMQPHQAMGGDPRLAQLAQLRASLDPQTRRMDAISQEKTIAMPGQQIMNKPMIG